MPRVTTPALVISFKQVPMLCNTGKLIVQILVFGTLVKTEGERIPFKISFALGLTTPLNHLGAVLYMGKMGLVEGKWLL